MGERALDQLDVEQLLARLDAFERRLARYEAQHPDREQLRQRRRELARRARVHRQAARHGMTFDEWTERYGMRDRPLKKGEH